MHKQSIARQKQAGKTQLKMNLCHFIEDLSSRTVGHIIKPTEPFGVRLTTVFST